jgi:hypothetical protein
MASILPLSGVFRYIRLEEIRRRPDARALKPEIVVALAASIRDVGLRNPINVRLIGDVFELVAGSHRLAAFELLGEAEIPAQEILDDDLHAELAMIDENLCRAELSPVDRARQTARRKAIYLELHPETAHGGNLEGAGVAKMATPENPSFATATAKRTGQSERAVRRDAERGEKIIPEVMELLKGTKLESGAYLDKLKGLSPNNQVTAAKRDLARHRREDASPVRKKGGIAARIKTASTAKPQPADPHRHLIQLLDEIAALAPADIIAACPARERAALCTRLSHLIDVFQQTMEDVAP